MSKYDPLSAHLAGRSGREWRASFADLQKVLGFALPKAARASKAWWESQAPTAPARAWTDAGWDVGDVDLARESVVFRKRAAAASDGEAEGASDEPAILKRLELGRGWGMALLAGGVALAAGLGALALRGVLRRK